MKTQKSVRVVIETADTAKLIDAAVAAVSGNNVARVTNIMTNITCKNGYNSNGREVTAGPVPKLGIELHLEILVEENL